MDNRPSLTRAVLKGSASLVTDPVRDLASEIREQLNPFTHLRKFTLIDVIMMAWEDEKRRARTRSTQAKKEQSLLKKQERDSEEEHRRIKEKSREKSAESQQEAAREEKAAEYEKNRTKRERERAEIETARLAREERKAQEQQKIKRQEIRQDAEKIKKEELVDKVIKTARNSLLQTFVNIFRSKQESQDLSPVTEPEITRSGRLLPPRDSKTGRFIERSKVLSPISSKVAVQTKRDKTLELHEEENDILKSINKTLKKLAEQEFSRKRPRDPKTGRFIKQETSDRPSPIDEKKPQDIESLFKSAIGFLGDMFKKIVSAIPGLLRTALASIGLAAGAGGVAGMMSTFAKKLIPLLGKGFLAGLSGYIGFKIGEWLNENIPYLKEGRLGKDLYDTIHGSPDKADKEFSDYWKQMQLGIVARPGESEEDRIKRYQENRRKIHEKAAAKKIEAPTVSGSPLASPTPEVTPSTPIPQTMENVEPAPKQEGSVISEATVNLKQSQTQRKKEPIIIDNSSFGSSVKGGGKERYFPLPDSPGSDELMKDIIYAQ